MQSIAPNIYIEQTFSNKDHAYFSNLFLVHAQPRSLMIDAGHNTEESKEIVLAMLRELQIDPKDLDVFLTHNHPDHAGLGRFLYDQGARVYLKKEERLTCAMICTYYKQSEEASLGQLRRYGCTDVQAQRILELALTEDYHYHDYDWTDYPIIDVAEGDHFQYGEYDFEVIPLAGHTKYQMGLAERNSKWLFVADTLSEKEALIISTLDMGVNLVEMHCATLDRFAAEFADYQVASGHCDPFFTVTEAVDTTKRYFEHITDRIEKMVRKAGAEMSLIEVVNLIFRYKPGKLEEDESLKLHFRIANTLACLEHLVLQGRMERKLDGDIWRWAVLQ